MSILALIASPADDTERQRAETFLADLRTEDSEVRDADPAEVAERVAASVGLDDAARVAVEPGGVTLLNRKPDETSPVMVNVRQHDPLRQDAGPPAGNGRRLFLVRHGEADTPDAEGRLRSHAPLPLTARGRTQAAALGRAFAALPVETVHASDIARAAETARGLAGERPVELHPGLRELALGEFEGAHADQVLAASPGFLVDPDASLPGGESIRMVGQRTGPVLDELLGATEGDLVVVAHGGVNRALLSHVLGLPLERAIRIRQDWAAVNVLEWTGSGWRVGMLNWTPEGIRELDHTHRTTHLHERAHPR